MVSNQISSESGPEGAECQLDDETIQLIAKAVSACLSEQEMLLSVLRDLRRAHIEGEDVQAELNDLYQRIPELATLSIFHVGDHLEEALDRIEREGTLAKTDLEEFRELWQEIDWIAPGIEAFRQQNVHDRPWTGGHLEVRPVDRELVVKHELRHGVDVLHSYQVGLAEFVLNNVARLDAITSSDGLDPELLTGRDKQSLVKCEARLRDITDALSGVIQAIDGEPEPAEQSARSPEAVAQRSSGSNQAADESRWRSEDASIGFE